ncbi:hypothetical protein KDK_00970 [Dictyobacter kobayashii]|uniref:Uncharacterized protein n=2 Tax=Dictyobacter kobayashii TaxID=2014872 RepID=A0A402AAW4_9CHLR|nr:hypothetical protein KDK_00970 [Dictyobacter kobayashii]
MERLGQLSRESSVQMKKTMARLREDVEDMYVEAQDLHYTWKDKGKQV